MCPAYTGRLTGEEGDNEREIGSACRLLQHGIDVKETVRSPAAISPNVSWAKFHLR